VAAGESEETGIEVGVLAKLLDRRSDILFQEEATNSSVFQQVQITSGPPSPLFNEYRVFLPPGIKRLRREVLFPLVPQL
jgi:hypothetical protein